MSFCEACGGDGLIEVGAYRGDESDTTTRECRLCGGVKATRYVPSVDEILDQVISYRHKQNQPQTLRERLTHRSSESGRRTVDLIVEPEPAAEPLPYIAGTQPLNPSTSWYVGFHERAKQHGLTPKQIADEWTERLRYENERGQREAENDTNSVMNDFLREDRRRQ